LNQTERLLRGALESAVRCIRGEIAADSYIGDITLLTALEKALTIPDGSAPGPLEAAATKQIQFLEHLEAQRLERDAQTPKLRDLFAMAAIQSPTR
jgi:hypothetical protein